MMKPKLTEPMPNMKLGLALTLMSILILTGDSGVSAADKAAPKKAAAQPANAPAKDPAKAPAKKTPPTRAELEAKLAKDMSNVVFTGTFTITGGNNDKRRKEKYTIISAVKAQNDLWIFTARIQYGQQDITLPIPINVKWAGDTPILTLTKMAIPGMGTFTTRVVIYENHYAGMWWHDKVGGHLFGTISPIKKKDTPKADTGKTSPPKTPQDKK